MKPEQALAVVFPEVAGSWHPEKNGVRTPENTSAKNSLVAHWRCAARHEWSETVAGRTGMPAWKRGDRNACRICVGHVVPTRFTCGHTVLVETTLSRPDRTCPTCRRTSAVQGERQRHAQGEAARTTYADTAEQVKSMLADVEIPDSLPAPLVDAWHSTAVTLIRKALVAEREFGKNGAAGTAKRQFRLALAGLPPTEAELCAAIEDRQVVVDGQLVQMQAQRPRGGAQPQGLRCRRPPVGTLLHRGLAGTTHLLRLRSPLGRPCDGCRFIFLR